MKEIDWSKAPDWANWAVLRDGFFSHWERFEMNSDPGWKYMPRPTQWQGPQDGLPPVGTECEMCDDRDTFLPVEIIAEKDGYRFGWHKETHRVFYSRDTAEFRPIHSERDKAVYELARELGDLCPMPEVVNKVIDLGYRKPMNRETAIYNIQRLVPDLDTAQAMAIADMLGHED